MDHGAAMAEIMDLLIPTILLLATGLALGRKQDAYNLMLSGATDGLKILLSLIPTLVVLLTGVSMLRASGAIDLIGKLCAPLLNRLGIPPETAALVLIRPISGSAALAVGAELMAQYGVDSLIGRTTAVMLGATETTFYTISIYFGAAGIVKTRYTVPAALLADFTGFFVAALTTRYLY